MAVVQVTCLVKDVQVRLDPTLKKLPARQDPTGHQDQATTGGFVWRGESAIAVSVCGSRDFTEHPQDGGQHCTREVSGRDSVGSKGQQAFSS